MPRTKISKAATDLNVAVPTIIEFLRKKGITVDDSPNARIDEDVYDILVKEYKPDRTLKTQSEQQKVDRQAAKAKTVSAPRSEEIKTAPAEAPKGPKVVGKIDLSTGKPANTAAKAPEAKAAAPAPAPAPAAPVQKPAAPAEEKAAPAAPAAPAAEVKNPEAPKAEAPKAETPKAEAPKPAAPAVKAEAPAAPKAPAAPAPKPEAAAEAKPEPAAKSTEPEVFTLGVPKVGPQINVIGKIDLSTLNQSTRPKKKGKEERRGAAKPGAPGAAGAGDRKKRKRIGGKEKIDIENPGQQIGRAHV